VLVIEYKEMQNRKSRYIPGKETCTSRAGCRSFCIYAVGRGVGWIASETN
jgi:hypothetical protein